MVKPRPGPLSWISNLELRRGKKRKGRKEKVRVKKERVKGEEKREGKKGGRINEEKKSALKIRDGLIQQLT